MSHSKKVFEIKLAGYPIQLYQQGGDTFSVWYGKQRRVGLTYDQAARELGESIMHALACESRITTPTIEGDDL